MINPINFFSFNELFSPSQKENKNEFDFKKDAKRFLKTLEMDRHHLVNRDENSLDDQVVNSTKLFLKNKKHFSHLSEYKKCENALLAYRFKIPEKCLDEQINPGFKDFAINHHLLNLLETQNQTLKYDDESYDILINYKGENRVWKEIKPLIDEEFRNHHSEIDLKDPYPLFVYGKDGLDLKKRSTWTKFEPLVKGKTDRFATHFIKDPLIFDRENKAYLIEFCSSATENYPRINGGDHSWVRLYHFEKTTEGIDGEIYSIGLYRPKKHQLIDNLTLPFRTKKGYLSYEVSEEWGINHEIKTIAKRISKIAFEKIIKKVEEDQRKNEIVFHLFRKNCDQYVSQLGELAGVKLDTERHFFELFTFIHLKNHIKQKLSNYPKPIHSLAHIIGSLFEKIIFLLTPFFNLFFYLLGSGSIEEELKHIKGLKPILHTIPSFFEIRNLYSYSPWVLVNPTKEKIVAWRKAEIEKLNPKCPEQKKRIDEISFEFPNEFLLKASS